jgi:hypothetical protein
MRAALAVGCALVLLAVTSPVVGDTAIDRSLAPRLGSGVSANEYWDLTAWLDSGERVVARFLVTNEGPGTETAAAVGHVVLADGALLPFQWGRTRGEWTLGSDGALKVGKATLELGLPTIVVAVDSKKHGIAFRLEIARAMASVSTGSRGPNYDVSVVMPAPVRGRIQDRDVIGTAALTHTWMDQSERDLLHRRVELLARAGDLALYVLDLTFADGVRLSRTLMTRNGVTFPTPDDVTVELRSAASGGDARYPLPTEWQGTGKEFSFRVAVGRELLRMDPLAILPQPFRLLMALGGRPQRVWADATAEVEGSTLPRTIFHGVAAASFSRPLQ